MALKARKWVRLFEEFVQDLRIKSKEEFSADKSGSKLQLWESQRIFLREVGEGLDNGVHVFNCSKSRQLGITTISLAIDLFWLAMHPNIIMALVTDTEKNRVANRALIDGYVKSFPEGYFGESFKVLSNNRSQMMFSNGSRLDLLVAGTKKKSISWGEGIGYGAAHLTECAAYGDVEGLKSLEEGFAQQNPQRLYVYESTSKGFNHWRTRFMAGLADPTQRSFFIGWWAGDTNVIHKNDARFAEYGLYQPTGEEAHLIKQVKRLYNHEITVQQLAWIRWKGKQAGSEQDLLEQNQPWTAEQSFVQTGYSFFQTRMIGADIKRVSDDLDGDCLYQGYRYEVDGDFFTFHLVKLDPEVDSTSDIQLKVWEEPRDDGQYVIGMDPAYGRNAHKDTHSLIVWRCYADKMVQVAEFCTADMDIRHAAWVLFHLCAAYKNSMANVEIMGPGRMIMMEFDHLRQLLNAEIHREKVEKREWTDAGSGARWFLYHRVDSPGPGYVYNFESSWKTKQMLMHGFRSSYISQELHIRSKKLLVEMSNVIDDGDTIGAPESRDEDKKDDRVFAAALSQMAWAQWIRPGMLADGDTYEVVKNREMNDNMTAAEKAGKGVRNIVYGFLKRMEEAAEDDTPAPSWREKMGL